MYVLFKKTPLHVVLHSCNGACRRNLYIYINTHTHTDDTEIVLARPFLNSHIYL